MPTFTVTKATGGTAKAGSLYVPPALQVPDGGAGTRLPDTGLNASFMADLSPEIDAASALCCDGTRFVGTHGALLPASAN